MGKEVFTGRTVQKRFIRGYLQRLIDESRDSRSFLSFRKQKDDEQVAPRIFIFYGSDGLGKTSLMAQSIEIAQEVGVEAKRSVKIAAIDWDEVRCRKGLLPRTARELMDALYSALTDSELGIAGHFTAYDDLARKISKIGDRRRELLDEEWPRESSKIIAADETADSSDLEQLQSTQQELSRKWLETRLNGKDLELWESGDEKLAQGLADKIAELSAGSPVVLALDSYELVGTPEIDAWLRRNFFTRIFGQKNQVALILSTEHPILKYYRNDFSDEMIYPVSLGEITLTRHDIARLAGKTRTNLSEAQADMLERRTAGIPLVVQEILDHIRKSEDLESLLPPAPLAQTSDISLLVKSIVERFLNSDDWNLKSRVLHLAMLPQINGKLLAQLWNVSYADTTGILNDLSEKSAFVSKKRIHLVVRGILRDFLIRECRRGIESPYADLLRDFSCTSTAFFSEQLSQLQTAITSAEKRYKDERYRGALLSYVAGILWHAPDEAFGVVPGICLECMQFAPELIDTILAYFDEFGLIFIPEQRRLTDTLRAATMMADPSLFTFQVAPGEQELAFLHLLSDSSVLLSDFQKSLLAQRQAEIAYRTGDLPEALKKLDEARQGFGPDMPETLHLFDKYSTIGAAFSLAGNAEMAVDALTKATSIRADKFQPWYEIGLAQISMEKFAEATLALNHACQLSQGNQDVWFQLGNAYAALEQHEEAVQAYARAVETGPGHYEIWFAMGKAFSSMDKHTEAVSALRKVVGSEPGHFDAWFAIGNSCSMLGQSDDAIEAFRRTVELQPAFCASWKAMGAELYGRGYFIEAADAYAHAAELDAQSSEIWNCLGSAWYGAGNYEEAIVACSKATAIDPALHQAWTTIGHSQTAMGNFRGAFDCFTKAAEINPGDYDVWNNIGNSLYSQNKYDEAIKAYRKAAQAGPEHDTTWYNIGVTYQIQNKFAESIEAYEKAVAIGPGNAETWYQKGRAHTALDQHEPASFCFSKTVELTPGAHDAWYRRGLAYAKIGDHAEAVTSFVKSAELWPADADIWHSMGLSYAALGHAQEAVGAFTEAVSLADKRHETWYQLGLASQILGLYSEAIEAFNKSLELAPDKHACWDNLGLSYYYLGQHSQALSAFKHAFELNGGDAGILYHMALANHAAGDYAEAERLYLEVTEKDPECADAWYNLALTYHAQGNLERAIDTYRSFVSTWPENGQAWYNLGLVYHMQKRYDEAIGAYREAIRSTPDATDIWYHLGTAFHAREQFGEAIQAYRKVVQLSPDKFDAWYNLGIAYYVWGHFEDAVNSFSKAVGLKQDSLAALCHLAAACRDANQHVRAVEACRKALAIKPADCSMQGILAFSLLLSGNSLEAVSEYNRLLSMPENEDEIRRALSGIRTALARNPMLQGGPEIAAKLESAPGMQVAVH